MFSARRTLNSTRFFSLIKIPAGQPAAEGKIFQSVSGGKNWREQKSGMSVNLNDIFFRDTREGWAIGDEGTILHTTTGGNIWKKVDLKVRHKLEKIVFNGRDGWTVGFGGTILRYADNPKINAPKILKYQN